MVVAHRPCGFHEVIALDEEHAIRVIDGVVFDQPPVRLIHEDGRSVRPGVVGAKSMNVVVANSGVGPAVDPHAVVEFSRSEPWLHIVAVNLAILDDATRAGPEHHGASV